MNKQSIEILNAITKYNDFHIDDKRLVIIESRDTGFSSGKKGPYLSFEDLTSEDFFEVYRYKKGLQENEDRKGK